jgi:hypothetical protein
MSKFYCPKEDLCGSDQAFWTKQTTFIQHYCGHFSVAESDYILGKLIPDYNGETKCAICPVKNKFATRAKYLGHFCHRHFDEEQLDWISEGFVPPMKKQETKFATLAELAEVDLKVKSNVKGKQKALSELKKGFSGLAKPTPAEIADNKSGISFGSNKTYPNMDVAFDPEAGKNPILKDPIQMEKLEQLFNMIFPATQYSLDLIIDVDEPQQYLQKHPKATNKDYSTYLKKEKAVVDGGAPSVDDAVSPADDRIAKWYVAYEDTFPPSTYPLKVRLTVCNPDKFMLDHPDAEDGEYAEYLYQKKQEIDNTQNKK